LRVAYESGNSTPRLMSDFLRRRGPEANRSRCGVPVGRRTGGPSNARTAPQCRQLRSFLLTVLPHEGHLSTSGDNAGRVVPGGALAGGGGAGPVRSRQQCLQTVAESSISSPQ
jgi:hypothetical protein